MQAIYKSERFQKDIERYQIGIDRMIEGKDKDEAKKLLSSLVMEVKKMDLMYMDMVYNKTLGSTGDEFRQHIYNIRKNLEDKIFKKNTA